MMVVFAPAGRGMYTHVLELLARGRRLLLVVTEALVLFVGTNAWETLNEGRTVLLLDRKEFFICGWRELVIPCPKGRRYSGKSPTSILGGSVGGQSLNAGPSVRSSVGNSVRTSVRPAWDPDLDGTLLD